MGRYIQSTKRQNLSTKNLYLAKLSFKSEREVKIFPDKQKLMEFKITRPGLQFKEVLQMKENEGILDSNSKPHGYKSNIHG